MFPKRPDAVVAQSGGSPGWTPIPKILLDSSSQGPQMTFKLNISETKNLLPES